MSYLINDDLSSLTRVYYEKLEDRDIPDWWDLLLAGCIKDKERQQRLDILSLSDIFTTGLPEDAAIRYYSS